MQCPTYFVHKEANLDELSSVCQLISNCISFIDALLLFWRYFVVVVFFSLAFNPIYYVQFIHMFRVYAQLFVCMCMCGVVHSETTAVCVCAAFHAHTTYIDVQNNSISNLQLVKCAFHQLRDAFIGIETLVDFGGGNRNPLLILLLVFSLSLSPLTKMRPRLFSIYQQSSTCTYSIC